MPPRKRPAACPKDPEAKRAHSSCGANSSGSALGPLLNGQRMPADFQVPAWAVPQGGVVYDAATGCTLPRSPDGSVQLPARGSFATRERLFEAASTQPSPAPEPRPAIRDSSVLHARLQWRECQWQFFPLPEIIVSSTARFLYTEDLVQGMSRVCKSWACCVDELLKLRVQSFCRSVWELPMKMKQHWDSKLVCVENCNRKDQQTWNNRARRLKVDINMKVIPLTQSDRRDGTFSLSSFGWRDEAGPLPTSYSSLWPELEALVKRSLALSKWSIPKAKTSWASTQTPRRSHACWIELPGFYAPLELPGGNQGRREDSRVSFSRLKVFAAVEDARP